MAKRRTTWGRAAVSLLLPVALLAGCADNDEDSSTPEPADLRGKVVTIAGPEVEAEAQGFLDAFKPFEDRTGIDVQYQGDRSFEQQIGARVDGGNAPDIGMFPQPGKVKDFKDDLKAMPTSVTNVVGDNFDSGWSDLVTIDGKLWGVPVKSDLKSLIWYSRREALPAAEATRRPCPMSYGVLQCSRRQANALVGIASKWRSSRRPSVCATLGSRMAQRSP